MKKCMEFRVEGRIPRRTWLESVEADMAELKINKEDVHDRNKWRSIVMKEKSHPNRNYKPIIIICNNHLLIKWKLTIAAVFLQCLKFIFLVLFPIHM